MSRNDDFWLGVTVLAIAVPLCIVAGYLIVRLRTWRLARHWAPLLPLFDTASVASSAGGTLRGTHRGRRFEARMAQGVSVDSEGDDRFNEFTLALLEVPGGHDWRVVQRSTGLLGLGQADWYVDADAPALAEGLRAAGAIEAALALGGADYTVAKTGPVLAYHRPSARLVLRRDAGDAHVPAPDTLRGDMAALLHWSDINGRINPPAARSGSPHAC